MVVAFALPANGFPKTMTTASIAMAAAANQTLYFALQVDSAGTGMVLTSLLLPAVRDSSGWDIR